MKRGSRMTTTIKKEKKEIMRRSQYSFIHVKVEELL
jgi:hypothetical protein